MKSTVDDKRRVALGRDVRTGDVYDVDARDVKRIILTRLEKPQPRSRLVRHKGYLMIETEQKVPLEQMFKAIQGRISAFCILRFHLEQPRLETASA